MALKGLSERFQERENEIYGRLSARTNGSAQPFIEIKPNDPNRSNTTNDTRFGAATSVTYTRDLTRIGKFLKTNNGVLFLLNQAELQTGNTFSETRVLNPLFVIGNVPNMIRIRRTLAAASDDILTDPERNPSADARIGSAGRLQKASKSKAIDNLKKSGSFNLFRLIPANKITRTISAINSIVNNNGIVGVNDRPEIDFGGELFSTAMWKGFTPIGKTGNPLDQVGSQLRRGNFKDALATTKSSINQIKQVFNRVKATKISNDPTAILNDRGMSESNYDGWRYFIRDKNDKADRYLNDSISYVPQIGIAGKYTSAPVVNLNVLNNKYVRLQGAPITPIAVNSTRLSRTASITSSKLGNSIGLDAKLSSKKIQNAITKDTDILTKNTARFLKSADAPLTRATTLTPSLKLGQIADAIDKVSNPVPTIINNNPAYDTMKYPELSLQARYAAMNSSLKASLLDDQKGQWGETFKNLSQTKTYGPQKKTLGISGGFRAGDVMPDDLAQRRIKYDGNGNYQNRGRYFYDTALLEDPIIGAAGKNEITNENMKKMRTAIGDTTDFVFFDYINKNALPFRAMLSELNESITPNISEQQYIGRIERNLVYVGVLRELSFEFRIQAFSSIEMDSVWKKINYLTGLTFPSKYSNGFLVPPFVKLTIGDVFRDQAGYIKSMNYKLDDNGWEIDDLYQAPMGITVNMTFSIIENKQMSTGKKFYQVGDPRKETPVDRPRAGTTSRPSAAQTVAAQTAGKIPSSVAGKGSGGTASMFDRSGTPIRSFIPSFVAPRDNTRVTRRYAIEVPPNLRIGKEFTSFGGGGGFSGATGGTEF